MDVCASLDYARGGNTPLYKPYRYVPPHLVGVLRHFGLKTVFYKLCPFWSGIGYGFRGNYGSVYTYLSFQFQMSKIEKYANSKGI